jgi:hypothetical protein
LNKDTFIKLVASPTTITADELKSLESVSENFAYSNLANILIAKANKDNGSMFANQKLKRAALFTSGRDKLRKLMQGEVTSKFIEVESKPKHTLDEIFESLAIAKARKDTEPNLDLVPISESLVDLVEKKTPEIEKSVTLKFYVHTQGFGKDPKKVKIDLISEYLAYRSEPKIETVDVDIQSEIIRNFLSSDESKIIKPNLDSGYSGEDLSKKSTQEKFEIITENMANIFVKQQKYKKAIEVFEKLMLKYPDKSTYFAEKISELNPLL